MIPISALERTATELMAKAAIEIPDDYLAGLRRCAAPPRAAPLPSPGGVRTVPGAPPHGARRSPRAGGAYRALANRCVGASPPRRFDWACALSLANLWGIRTTL